MATDMNKIRTDLKSYGITDVKEIYYNPSFEELFNHEMDPQLEGFEKGQLSELGAVNVMTGIFTGRSPKDKYIVMDDTTKDNVWWAHPGNRSDNPRPMSIEMPRSLGWFGFGRNGNRFVPCSPDCSGSISRLMSGPGGGIMKSRAE